MTTLRLILGDQLNPLHSWYSTVRPDVVYALMEIRQETDYARHHAQKILGIFAAMRAFAQQLKSRSHRVRYITISDASNRQSLPANLDALCRHYGVVHFEYQEPDEWRLEAQLRTWCEAQTFTSTIFDSEHFLASRDAVAKCFGNHPHWLMETFYRQMRRAHGVLLDADGHPAGGKWDFDHDNRKAWPGSPPAPADLRNRRDHSALWHEIVAAGIGVWGKPDAGNFPWPLHREDALNQLDDFIAHALPHFGAYQDAMASDSWRLFHSLLSFAMNVKMLHPCEVIRRAEQCWHEGHVPLAAAEGFIRQILGWREYVRGVYWARMPGYTELNALDHTRSLPEWFWNGDTHMRCLQLSIRQSLEQAYAHHIQRLMVIGNFSLLAGLDPRAVHEWYLGIYIDAFEWVEAPNTLGMSQFADGGVLATKPYVSGAAYIRRMGDYCSGCRYDPKIRTGARACPFNALYWNFFERHADRLRDNPRLAMVYRNLERMDAPARQALREQARIHLRDIEQL